VYELSSIYLKGSIGFNPTGDPRTSVSSPHARGSRARTREEQRGLGFSRGVRKPRGRLAELPLSGPGVFLSYTGSTLAAMSATSPGPTVSTPPASPDGLPLVTVAAAVRSLASRVAKLPVIWVEGELSSVSSRGGAVVFAQLRDPDEQVAMTLKMWQRSYVDCSQLFVEGRRILAKVRAELYVPKGTLQFHVIEVRAVGLGALLAEIAARKAKYQAEGLFDAARKRPLPSLPARIGVIAGRNSDALRDFAQITQARWPSRELAVREVPVQGPGAPAAMADALRELDADPAVEVIVITRGGGSPEELMTFDADVLCRAIATSRTPVVTAIGHEADTHLCDLIADVRASTPTDAAARTTPDQAAWLARLDDAERRLADRLRRALTQREQQLSSSGSTVRRLLGDELRRRAERLEHLAARPVLASPTAPLTVREVHLDRLGTRAALAAHAGLRQRQVHFGGLAARLDASSPARRIAERERRLDDLDRRLVTAMRTQLRGATRQLESSEARLRGSAPQRRVAALEQRLVELSARPPLADPERLVRGRTDQLAGRAERLSSALRALLIAIEARLNQCDATLRAVSPLATLDRGYAIVQLPNGRVVRDPADVTVGELLRLRVAVGELEARAV